MSFRDEYKLRRLLLKNERNKKQKPYNQQVDSMAGKSISKDVSALPLSYPF